MMAPEVAVLSETVCAEPKVPGAGLKVGAAIAANPVSCRPLVAWLEAWNAVAMTVIRWGMALAPLGVYLVTAIGTRAADWAGDALRQMRERKK